MDGLSGCFFKGKGLQLYKRIDIEAEERQDAQSETIPNSCDKWGEMSIITLY